MNANPSQTEHGKLDDALLQISASMDLTHDLNDIMNQVMSAAVAALGCHSAGVLLHEEGAWIIRYVHGFPLSVIGRRYSDQEMPHARSAVQTRKVVVIPDAKKDPRIPAGGAAEYAVRGMMVVPVLAGGGASGALFFNYRDGPIDFSREQIEFGRKLAGILSLTLDNARLYDAEREGRAFFASMFDHAPMGIVLLEGPDLRAVTANAAYLSLLEEPWRSRGIIAEPLASFMAAAVSGGLAVALAEAAESGEEKGGSEYHLVHPERGSTYWRWTAAPVEVEEDAPRRVMLILSEITDEVKARDEAQALAAQVRSFALDLQTANDRLQAQTEELEVQSEELRSQNDELVETHEALREAHERLEDRVHERTAELMAANAALADREASLRATALNLEAEVADRRRAEAELAAQANLLRDQADLLELTNDTILVRDLNAHILYWNRGAEAQYGYAREEVLGKRSHALLKTQFPVPPREVYSELLETGRWEGELTHTRRDGSEIVVFSRWALQRDENGEPVRVLEINNDITARKQAEQALWRHTQRLEILHEIDLSVLAAHSSQQIALATAQHLRQIIRCERAAVVVFDFERGQAARLAVDADGETASGTLAISALEEYEWWPEHQEGKPFATDDLSLFSSLSPFLSALLAAGLHSFVTVPLLVQGRLIGWLNLSAAQAQAFTPADVDIAGQVADSLAVALEQARLNEREHQAREVAEALRQANVALTQSLDLETVLEALLGSLQRLMQYRSAQVLLLEDDSCLVLRARKTSGEAAPAPASVATRVLNVQKYPAYNLPLTTGESLLIPDTNVYPGWDLLPLLDAARNWLGVPLIAGGKVLGLLSIYGDRPSSFTDEHVHVAEAIAGQAAVALQNARLFQQIDAARRQLQALSRRLVDIQEDERRYIARELHDEAGQALTSLLVGLGLIARELTDKPDLVARVGELKQMADGIMANLHRLSAHLRPAVLDRFGLVPALRQHVEAFLHENNLAGEFETVGFDDAKLSPEVEITVYRVVQEALTNVARHAHASHVGVILEKRTTNEGEARILVIIEDDGVGFDPVQAAQRGRLGVFGMEERAQVLGGTFQVESTPKGGTTIFVEIPV